METDNSTIALVSSYEKISAPLSSTNVLSTFGSGCTSRTLDSVA